MSAGLRISGTWPLAGQLVAVAAARNVRVDVVTSTGTPVLSPAGPDSADGGIALPDSSRLGRALIGRVVARLIAAITPAPAYLSGVVLTPAAGMCGPAGNGPIDAVRNAGQWPIDAEIPVSLRFLDTQQTRCWLLAADIGLAVTGQAPRVEPGPLVRVLPPAVSADTARVCEFLSDLGPGQDWPGICLLGPPQLTRDDCASVLVLCTDAPYLADLIETCLTGSREAAR